MTLNVNRCCGQLRDILLLRESKTIRVHYIDAHGKLKVKTLLCVKDEENKVGEGD